MDYNIDKVEQNPAALLIAGPAETLQLLFSCRLADFVGDCTHLPVTCAGGDYEIICSGRFAFQVEYHNITAMPLSRHSSGSQSKRPCLRILPFCQLVSLTLFNKKRVANTATLIGYITPTFKSTLQASGQLPKWSQLPIIGENFTITPANTTLTMLISLMRIFRLGPEVSLNGSPTVSPTTAAL